MSDPFDSTVTFRGHSRVSEKFEARCEKTGVKVPDMLRELMVAFGEDRLVIKLTDEQKAQRGIYID